MTSTGSFARYSLVYRVLFACVFAACAFALSRDAEAQGLRILDVPATSFYVYELSLAPQQGVTFETTGGAGVDEVLHLFRISSTGSWTHIISNDNTSGYFGSPPYLVSARIAYTHTLSTASTYRLVVRAKTAGTTGTAAFRVNGSVVATAIPVAGYTISSSYFASGSGSVHAVPQPGGSEWSVIMAFNSSATTTPTRVGYANGAAGATFISKISTDLVYFFGTPVLLDWRKQNGHAG